MIDVIVDDQRIARQAAGFVPAHAGNEAIDHWDQVLGVAVAESFEAARDAARQVRVHVAVEPGKFDTLRYEDEASGPPRDSRLQDAAKGDIDAAMADAAITIDQVYTTPHQVHAAMEPHASIASWDGDRLTLHSSLQILGAAKQILAAAVGIEADKVRIFSPYIGGGFGGKMLGPEAVAAAIAAQRIGRPVKIAMARQQLFHNIYRRTDTHQRVRLAATADGKLTALGHDSVVSQGPDGGFMEPVALGSLSMYAAPVRHFSHRVVTLDLVMAGAVRAPGEAVGMLALETAIDEMAERLGLDPIEFRKMNEPAVDPMSGRPFSTRALVPCLEEGAKRFGWERRPATPGGWAEGEWLIGMGVAAAVRINLMMQSRGAGQAIGRWARDDRNRHDRYRHRQLHDPRADRGRGARPADRSDRREAGRYRSPHRGGIGRIIRRGERRIVGRAGLRRYRRRARTADGCHSRRHDPEGRPCDRRQSARAACRSRRQRTDRGARQDQPGQERGNLQPGSARRAIRRGRGQCRHRRGAGPADAGRVRGGTNPQRQDRAQPGDRRDDLGDRLRACTRMRCSICAPASSSITTSANIMSRSHADVPHIDVHFIEEIDEHANPIGVKGLGELSISGAGAAVTNAIYNACGVRVRDFPMTLDKLLAGLPPV